MARPEISAPSRTRIGPGIFLALLLLLLIAGTLHRRQYAIEYNWWHEMGQVNTWLAMLAYSLAPVAIAAAAVVFAGPVCRPRARNEVRRRAPARPSPVPTRF